MFKSILRTKKFNFKSVSIRFSEASAVAEAPTRVRFYQCLFNFLNYLLDFILFIIYTKSLNYLHICHFLFKILDVFNLIFILMFCYNLGKNMYFQILTFVEGTLNQVLKN